MATAGYEVVLFSSGAYVFLEPFTVYLDQRGIGELGEGGCSEANLIQANFWGRKIEKRMRSGAGDMIPECLP